MPPIYTRTSCSTTFILILTLIQKGNYYYFPSYPFTEEKLRIRKAQAQWFTQDCATVSTLLWWSITHSSTLAWKIPWTEEPGGLQSMGLLGVGHDWETSLSLFTFMHWRRKWQPTPVFLPGESLEWGSLVGCPLWGHTKSDTTEATSQHRNRIPTYSWFKLGSLSLITIPHCKFYIPCKIFCLCGAFIIEV